MAREDEMIATINNQKGQIMALQSLTISLLRAMPIDMQARALDEWDKETEIAKTVFLNSAVPDQCAEAYDAYVQVVNDQRRFPPGG